MATIPPNPDWFVYSGPILSRFEVYPLLTGTGWVSFNPASWQFNAINLPSPVGIKYINVFKSFNAGIPTATGQASTGSEGYSYSHGVSIFVRENYSAESTNMSFIGSASAGITATLGYSSTSQQFGMSWLTDASGGTAAYTTTSNNANWSSFVTGPKIFAIPISGPIAGKGTTLSAGEYFFAHQHGSSTATSNSNVALLSASLLRLTPQAQGFGVMGSSAASIASSGEMGIGYGQVSAVTTSTTMAGSLITTGAGSYVVQNYSNA